MRHQNFLASLIIGTAIAPAIAADGADSEHDPEPATYCLYEIEGGLPGLPPSGRVLVRALNNHHKIVGSYFDRAFIWDRKHGMRALGALPGHSRANALDINEAGTVIGWSNDPAGGEFPPFIWDRRTGMRPLDVSLGGLPSRSFAFGINRSGQIVGLGETATGENHAFFRDVNGEVLDIGVFQDGDFFSRGVAVNDIGQVVGFRGGSGRKFEGFVWDKSNGTQLLGETPPPARHVRPWDINVRGVVVGQMVVADAGEVVETRAFRWTKADGFQDLGTLSGPDTHNSLATAINRSGAIVGGSETTEGAFHAFIWSRKSGMRDLNELIDPSSAFASQGVLRRAEAINKFGEIAALGSLNIRSGFLLVPRLPGGAPCR